jgi:hypothetical protein
VTVIGRVDPDIVSYCMQGPSLVVISASPA